MTLTCIKQRIIKIIITPFILATLLMPVCYAENSHDALGSRIVTVEQTFEDENISSKAVTKRHKEAKHVFAKFLHTLLLVGGSCIVIYILLGLYKKYSSRKKQILRNIDVTKDLESPETIEDAIKLFIEKF